MKIGILGTRGIPNRYGGFEQLATYLSRGLAGRGHEIYVYNPHHHDWREEQWGDVHLVRCYDPDFLGSAGQFIYDLNAVLDSRKMGFDAILMLGYTSSSIWHFLFPEKTRIIYHMDGMEWKRSKYGRITRQFLHKAESWAVKHSNAQIADSPVIADFLRKKYHISPHYIPYAALPFEAGDKKVLRPLGLHPFEYDLVIARLEPENHIEMIIRGTLKAGSPRPLLIIGDPAKRYGQRLKEKYDSKDIRFAGPVYDQELLNNLRFYSQVYFHGHSVGGTNPSLVEAMASGALIVAHDNPFNRYVLDDGGFYFSSLKEIAKATAYRKEDLQEKLEHCKKRVRKEYSLKRVIDDYGSLIEEGNSNHLNRDDHS